MRFDQQKLNLHFSSVGGNLFARNEEVDGPRANRSVAKSVCMIFIKKETVTEIKYVGMSEKEKVRERVRKDVKI